jgi:pyridoxal phosphate enzyme (YggS family)
VTERVGRVEEQVEAAAARSGRTRDSVVLVGASKRQPVAALQEAWDAGLRVFGENRVQEAVSKAPELPAQAEWHLIGPLQTNKARRAVEIFSVVQTVDRLRVAEALDRHCAALGRRLQCFLEINLGGESSKHGFLEDELDGAIDRLADLDRLDVVGLMAIPPQAPTPEASRPWFRQLRELRDRYTGSRLGAFEGYLSMGMSADFEIAIEEGATHVRVGTALFGPRPAIPTTPA